MKDAQLIYRWQLCQQKSKEIGMEIATNAENLIAKGQNRFYCAESVDGLLGYIEGVEAERRADSEAVGRG